MTDHQCIALIGDDDQLCGAPATCERIVEGLLCHLCSACAAELDRDTDTTSEDTMTTTTNTTSRYATTYHDDGSVTVWDVYQQRWLTTTHVRDEVLASLPEEERERVLNHLAWTHDDA
jgi:hypothetical protein